jgi:hypothetical protein
MVHFFQQVGSMIISLSRWKEAFKDQFGLVILRAKPSSSALLNNWLSSLPQEFLVLFLWAYGLCMYISFFNINEKRGGRGLPY